MRTRPRSETRRERSRGRSPGLALSRSCEESNINVMIIGVLDRIAALLAGGFCVLLYRVLHAEAVRPEATVADGSPG